MKRLLTLAALFLCCTANTFAQFSGSGSGTENDPYLILNPIQLNQLRNFLNQSNVYFKIMADINLTEYLEDENPSQGWQPVGSSSASFKGIVDGNGKTVSGLWIKRANTDYVGFFGNTDGATIKNLKIVATTIVGKDIVGGLSGYSKNSNFSDCTFKGEIQGGVCVGGYIGSSGNNITLSEDLAEITVIGTSDNVGGLIGKGVGGVGVSNCKILGTKIQGNNYVGGICGTSTNGDNNYYSCYVYSSISGIDYVGGICGQTKYYRNNLTDCGFIGNINANSIVGGIAGEYSEGSHYDKYDNPNPTLINCYSIGNIVASGNDVGGIVGRTNATSEKTGSLHQQYTVYHVNEIAFSYFNGNVKGVQNVGGIVGFKQGGGVISCYSRGNVFGDSYIGGICGKMDHYGFSELKSNIANVISIKANQGFLGRVYGSCNSSNVGKTSTSDENKAYNRAILIDKGIVQDVEDNEQNGTGVSATTLKLKATYVAMGWDFTDIWDIQETECYPYMKSQTAPPVITSQLVSGATTISGKCVDGGTVTLDVDGVKQQIVSTGHEFFFTVSPLQAGHEVRICAKAEGKEQSYYTTEIVAYLGKGTEADPYQVYTASDLTGVYRKGYFKLMNDIDLTSYINQFSPSEGWESIGRDGSETIHFDGNGHKITGLWCNSTRDNTGLFSCFANGTIKNLTVETAKNKQVKGGANTGILIGKMINGTIENCRVLGSVADGTPVGGMVGLFDGGKISLSQANVTINTTLGTSYVGGLVGEITGGEINQCVTQGTITATGSESYVGGLVGKNSATVTNCYSNAIITSTYNAAGLIAYNYGVVDKCYATGNIFSSNYGAGVIGYNDGTNAVVKNCVAMNNKIDVTYESQQVQQGGGYGQRVIGGIKNSAPAPELNNYALKTMQVSLNNVPQKVYDDIMNGVGKNVSDLAKGSTYQELGWNFSSVWSIVEGESYPSLKNNAAAVLQPGEEPDPGENPEPEPVLSTDDQIVIDEVSASKGKTTTLTIGLNNKTTTFCAYQFDLKLPAGFTLLKNDNNKYKVSKTNRYTDESQTLDVSAVSGSGNTYRFVCFSLSSSVIEGTNGALLNAIIEADNTTEPGAYEGLISDIVFTKTDGTSVQLNSVKFNIVVSNVLKGDVNNDGLINVADVVNLVNYILEKPANKFVIDAADVNGDNLINIADVVCIVRVILGQATLARMRAAQQEDARNDRLSLAYMDRMLTLSLENQTQYAAAQFDISISEGQEIESISLAERTAGLQLSYARIDANTYRVMLYGLGGGTITGESGELLNIKLSDTVGMVDINNILFVTGNLSTHRFGDLHASPTGILSTERRPKVDIYTVEGKLVKKQTDNIDGLKKGIYIINNHKIIVK